MVEFVKSELADLVATTKFLHQVKPSISKMFVYGIEKPKPNDRSIVFHLVPMEKDSEEGVQTVLLSCDYILEMYPENMRENKNE